MTDIKELRKKVLIMLQDLADEIGQSVTWNYNEKHGIWEGLSLDISRDIDAVIPKILNLIQSEREEAVKRYSHWELRCKDCGYSVKFTR